MAHKIFVKIDGIAGESRDFRHEDEIEVLGWNWSFLNQTKTTTGGGISGKPVVSGINFTHKIDRTSPLLMKSCLLGTHIKEAKLSVNVGGERTGFDHYVLLVKEVLISSVVQTENEDHSFTLESVTIVFTNVTEEYTITKQDGTAGQKVIATFDIKTNK